MTQYFIVTVDLSNIQPTTELEKKLLAMLHSADERYSELKSQFEDYQTMVKKTFLDNIIDDTRRYEWVDGRSYMEEDRKILIGAS